MAWIIHENHLKKKIYTKLKINVKVALTAVLKNSKSL